ncbi:MAG: universal stress protein [Sphingobacteriaceae bacterium]|nr:universal stress protein [Sphingobacteriaceae bacterium]
MKTSNKIKPIKTSKIKRILVPFDFSPFSSNALREAIFVAKCFMAEIELLHVIAPVYLDANSSALLPTNDSFYNRLLKQAENNLKKITKEITKNEGVKISCSSKLNVIHQEIISFASKKKVDLIIMGTHGTSGISEFFAGSNAYRVVSEAKCPVLTLQKRIKGISFKRILLPIRLELNSRQKVNFVATLAKVFVSKIYIVGYLESNSKSDKLKVQAYMKQVKSFLDDTAIPNESCLLKSDNFTEDSLKFAKKNKIDLITTMSKHDFNLKQLIKGSYTQQFVNHSPIPVLSVPNTIEFEYSFTNPLIG